MKRFSELLDALIFSPRRNVKLAHLSGWLRQTPHPDRGWGLAALTGDLDFSHVKAGVVRELGPGVEGLAVGDVALGRQPPLLRPATARRRARQARQARL